MNFEKSKNEILGELTRKLTNDQRKRSKSVPDLLKIRRDEADHFRFHRRGYHGHTERIYNVLHYLFHRFGSEIMDVREAFRDAVF